MNNRKVFADDLPDGLFEEMEESIDFHPIAGTTDG